MSGSYVTSAPEMDNQPASRHTEDLRGLEPADVPERPVCVKALWLREPLQRHISQISAIVQEELEAGQQELLLARGLATSRSWNAVVVRQEAMDMVVTLRSMLTTEPNVRLSQTVSSLNPHAMYISRNALYVQFNPGFCKAAEFLTMEEDCAIILPLIMPEGARLFACDSTPPARSFALALKPSCGYIITGRTLLNLSGRKPLVCLVFSMAGLEETMYPTYRVDTPSDPHEGMRQYRALAAIPIVWKTKEDAAKSLYYEFL